MNRKIVFPSVESANEDGLVAIGGDLEVDTLLEAYRRGIFPWPISTYPQNKDLPHTWFSPNPRGILDFQNLHTSKSFLKFLKKSPFKVTFNQKFEEVILNCAQTPRRDQPGTWITPSIIDAYKELFHAGYAYSVEVWEQEILVGGLYGVTIGNFFSGESMFTSRDNASKQGFYELIRLLKSKGVGWLDTQMVTEVVKQFGGNYIPRPIFLLHLEQVDWTKRRVDFF